MKVCTSGLRPGRYQKKKKENLLLFFSQIRRQTSSPRPPPTALPPPPSTAYACIDLSDEPKRKRRSENNFHSHF